MLGYLAPCVFVSVFVPYFSSDFLSQRVCVTQVGEGRSFCGEGGLTTPSTLVLQLLGGTAPSGVVVVLLVDVASDHPVPISLVAPEVPRSLAPQMALLKPLTHLAAPREASTTRVVGLGRTSYAEAVVLALSSPSSLPLSATRANGQLEVVLPLEAAESLA